MYNSGLLFYTNSENQWLWNHLTASGVLPGQFNNITAFALLSSMSIIAAFIVSINVLPRFRGVLDNLESCEVRLKIKR